MASVIEDDDFLPKKTNKKNYRGQIKSVRQKIEDYQQQHIVRKFTKSLCQKTIDSLNYMYYKSINYNLLLLLTRVLVIPISVYAHILFEI